MALGFYPQTQTFSPPPMGGEGVPGSARRHFTTTSSIANLGDRYLFPFPAFLGNSVPRSPQGPDRTYKILYNEIAVAMTLWTAVWMASFTVPTDHSSKLAG